MNDNILSKMKEAESIINKHPDTGFDSWPYRYLELAKIAVGNPDLKLFSKQIELNSELEEMINSLKNEIGFQKSRKEFLKKKIKIYEETGCSEEVGLWKARSEFFSKRGKDLSEELDKERSKLNNCLVDRIKELNKKIRKMESKQKVVSSRKTKPRKNNGDSRR